MPRPGVRNRPDIAAFARGGSVMQTINVTPMIDVMLVLLIIFMVVTPIITAGFRGELPDGVFLKSRPEDEKRITLGIDHDGNCFLQQRPITKADLPAALTRLYATGTTDRVLFLKADRRLRYQLILDAMAIARAAGVRVVGAVTEQRTPEESPGRVSAARGIPPG
jgi:biopolymer transport protein ExbD